MTIYLKAGGQLRNLIRPDVDRYTRRVVAENGKTVEEILRALAIDPAYVAFIYADGRIRDFSFTPVDGQTITLQPPVSGG